MNPNDYDDDGNNIVPCPICNNVHCAGNEDGGKCPEEDMFALEGEIRMLLDEYKETGDNSRIANVLEAVEKICHQQLQKARESWLREEIVKLEGMKVTPVHNSECLNNEVPEYCDCDNWIKRNQALQTIIDRYNSELDKDTNK
jgi:hypothetical protein